MLEQAQDGVLFVRRRPAPSGMYPLPILRPVLDLVFHGIASRWASAMVFQPRGNDPSGMRPERGAEGSPGTCRHVKGLGASAPLGRREGRPALDTWAELAGAAPEGRNNIAQGVALGRE